MVFSCDQPWSIVFRPWSDAFKDKVVNPPCFKYAKKLPHHFQLCKDFHSKQFSIFNLDIIVKQKRHPSSFVQNPDAFCTYLPLYNTTA